MVGRPINEDRKNALELGLPTYSGTACRKCGGTERYTTSCGCTTCAREKGQRARDALRAQEAEAVKHEQKPAVDNSQNHSYEASIEDLM